MRSYIFRRLLAAIPVLILVSLISFMVLRLVPGDAAAEFAGATATEEEIAQIRNQLGLDKPILTQLVSYYKGLATGDLGDSILLGRPVAVAIIERAPVTLSLTGLALFLTITIGISAGVLAATFHNTAIDQGVMATSLFGMSIPDFWLGLVFIYLFAVVLGWLPVGGYIPISEDFWGWFRNLLLPSFALALTQLGLLARMTRASMLEMMRQDFVRTARSKGVPEWKIILRHALANVMIPVVTVIGLSAGILLSGAIVIEQVYSLPGVGRLIIGAILRRDYPVIQGGLLLTAFTFVFVNLVVDILYAYLDPRVRYEQS